jgi:hypothetical protein
LKQGHAAHTREGAGQCFSQFDAPRGKDTRGRQENGRINSIRRFLLENPIHN